MRLKLPANLIARRDCRTQYERLFDTLSDLRWHTTGELNFIVGHRFSAQLTELRRQGYEISRKPARNKQWKYRLISLEPGEPIERKVRFDLDRSYVKNLKDRLESTMDTLSEANVILQEILDLFDDDSD